MKAILLAGLILCGCGGGSGSSGTFSGSGSGTTFTNVTTTATTTTSGNQALSTFNLTLVSNGNATVLPFVSGAPLARVDTTVTTNRFQANFYSTVTVNQLNKQRALAVVLTKSSSLQAGDVFTFTSQQNVPGAYGNYNESDPNGTRNWTSASGTVTVNSISGNSASLTLTSLQLTPTSGGANTATGTVTFNGSATLNF